MKILLLLGVLKSIISRLDITCRYHSGDIIKLTIAWDNKIIFEKEVDIMPGV